MAYWNIDFSNVWLKKLIQSGDFPLYDNTDYPKNPYTDLPELLQNSGDNINELVKQRIADFIARGFVDYRDEILPMKNPPYLVCYGESGLYFYPPRLGTNGHPPGAILYLQSADLMSTKYLQTLPTNREILIYSYSGQLSAAVVAYLNIMGYQSKSLLYGACQLFYSRLLWSPDLIPYTFVQSRISNFSYVKEE